MIIFSAAIRKFEQKGEKTGWTYIDVSSDLAEELNPGVKKSYRVKGLLNGLPYSGLSLTPMGKGHFILALNAELRKRIRKPVGAEIHVQMEVDTMEKQLSSDMLECLEDAPEAKDFFNSLTRGHQNYFSNWIESAKTEETRARRIVMAVQGLSMRLDYSQTIRYFKDRKQQNES